MNKAEVIGDTEKSFAIKPLDFECEEAIYIPKSQITGNEVAQWLCKKLGLEGELTLVNLPENGGNNGGAKVTNANLLSVPIAAEVEAEAIDAELEEEFSDSDGIDRENEVEIGDEDAGTRGIDDEIDDLEDIDDGEPEPGKEEERKDMFGEQAKKEIEKIKREQGQASKDEQPAQEEEVEDTESIIPPEVTELIEEVAVLYEYSIKRGRKVVDNVFTDDELNEGEKAQMAQDTGISIAITVRRGY